MKRSVIVVILALVLCDITIHIKMWRRLDDLEARILTINIAQEMTGQYRVSFEHATNHEMRPLPVHAK